MAISRGFRAQSLGFKPWARHVGRAGGAEIHPKWLLLLESSRGGRKGHGGR